MRLDEFRRPRAYNCYRFLRSLGWSRRRAWRWIASDIERAVALGAGSPRTSSAPRGVVMDDLFLKWVADRMDLLAFTTPTEQTWESIYKKVRHEVEDQRVAIHQRRKETPGA